MEGGGGGCVCDLRPPDWSQFWSIAGQETFLTGTWPDIFFQRIGLYPREADVTAFYTGKKKDLGTSRNTQSTTEKKVCFLLIHTCLPLGQPSAH